MKALTMIYEAKSRQVIKYLKELQKREKAYHVVGSTVAASNPGVLQNSHSDFASAWNSSVAVVRGTDIQADFL
jgi:hypothetical protein